MITVLVNHCNIVALFLFELSFYAIPLSCVVISHGHSFIANLVIAHDVYNICWTIFARFVYTESLSKIVQFTKLHWSSINKYFSTSKILWLHFYIMCQTLNLHIKKSELVTISLERWSKQYHSQMCPITPFHAKWLKIIGTVLLKQRSESEWTIKQ